MVQQIHFKPFLYGYLFRRKIKACLLDAYSVIAYKEIVQHRNFIVKHVNWVLKC